MCINLFDLCFYVAYLWNNKFSLWHLKERQEFAPSYVTEMPQFQFSFETEVNLNSHIQI